MDEPDDRDKEFDGVIRQEADEVNRVILVAAVGSGTTPAASTGQPRSPTYAVIMTIVSLNPAGTPDEQDYYLHFYFDEGLSVLREQYWGSRSSLDELRRCAALCGIPADRWQHAHQDWPDPIELPEALQPSTGPRLRAQRSYDIAVWPGDNTAETPTVAAESYANRRSAQQGPPSPWQCPGSFP